jgi:DNA-binding NarL/FixJ family response regulator
VRQIELGKPGVPTSATIPVRVLVISQHEAVRRQLVDYLARSSALTVSGESFSADAIHRARPDVVVLDLSRLGPHRLDRVIADARAVDAALVALASMRDDADERAVLAAGGRYCLKSAGPGGLAETVRSMARQQD